MTQKEIIAYAVKGLENEIWEIEDSIQKGKKILKARMNDDHSDLSPMTFQEIENIIQSMREKMDILAIKKNKLEWDLI